MGLTSESSHNQTLVSYSLAVPPAVKVHLVSHCAVRKSLQQRLRYRSAESEQFRIATSWAEQGKA